MKVIHKSLSFNKKTFTPETLITISIDGYALEDFHHIKRQFGENELALILGLRMIEIIEGTNPEDLHVLTNEEREALNRAFWKSVEVIDEGIDETTTIGQNINVHKAAECPNALLPDGPVCPRCGGRRGPSGVDGGSWVHF